MILHKPDHSVVLFQQNLGTSDGRYLFGLPEVCDFSLCFSYRDVYCVFGSDKVQKLAVRSYVSFFLEIVSFRGKHTMCVRAALSGSFMEYWKSVMAAPSFSPFESPEVLTLRKNNRIGIGSDSLNTADFICISIYLAHFAVFS